MRLRTTCPLMIDGRLFAAGTELDGAELDPGTIEAGLYCGQMIRCEPEPPAPPPANVPAKAPVATKK